MKLIEKCERCGNEETGARAYHCIKCKTWACDACLGDDVGRFSRDMSSIFYHSFCPECDSGGWIAQMAEIGKKTEIEHPENDGSGENDENDEPSRTEDALSETEIADDDYDNDDWDPPEPPAQALPPPRKIIQTANTLVYRTANGGIQVQVTTRRPNESVTMIYSFDSVKEYKRYSVLFHELPDEIDWEQGHDP